MTAPTPSSIWVIGDGEGDVLHSTTDKDDAEDHFQMCVDEPSDFRTGPYTLTEYVPKRDLAAAQSEPASVKAERDALKNLLAECETTLAHARVFIGTREKMHPDGQFLYDELLAQVRAQCAAHPKEGA